MGEESSQQQRPDPSDGPAARAGMSVREYDYRVRDMAKSLLHPAGIYVLLLVIGMTRLLGHEAFEEPGAGWWREGALFAAGFLGAWAVVLSTLLRDAGLRSATVTFLVPLTLVGVLIVYLAFPEPVSMGDGQLVGAALVLVGPAPIAWVATIVRWRRARREVSPLLAGGQA